MPQKIWLITGVSSGFGEALAKEVIAQGDFVIGTLRKPEQIKAFNAQHAGKAFAVQMDVTDAKQVALGIEEALKQKGQIDVLVNNAGYGLFGAVEETSEAEARAQMETNFFGALAVTQAVLPSMRKAKKGHIVQISSVAGFRSTPGLGLYNASKHALEGMSEALALEVALLGIRVTIIEPGPFRTQWAGGGSKDVAKKIDDYAKTAHHMSNTIHGYDGNQPGDPVKGARAIIKAVEAKNPPLRLPLGEMALARIREKIVSLSDELHQWEPIILDTAF